MSGLAMTRSDAAVPLAPRAALPGWRRLFDPVWHVSGAIPLAPGQSADAAFDRLDPLMQENGTTHERTANVVSYGKTDPGAQDPLATFEHGEFRIEPAPPEQGGGLALHYRLASRTLLCCFFAPLLFLGFAGLTVAAGELQSAPPPKAEEAAKAPKVKTLHPIDQMLGAPAPEAPKKPDPAKAAADKKPSPTSAYVFAALFALLYGVGRVLEPWLVRRRLTARLLGE